MADKVEKELQQATGIKPKAKEARQAYLTRLNGAVGELSDEDWKALSKAAGTWANAATKAFDADKPLPDFTDAEADEPKAKAKGKAAQDDEGDPADDETTSSEGEEAEAEADAEDEDEPVKIAMKKSAAKKPAKADTKKSAAEAKPAKKSPAKKGAAGGPGPKVGVIDALKEVLEGGKALTVAEIHAKLLKKFPDRGDAMLNTIRTQLSVLPAKGYAIKKVKGDDGVTYQKGGKAK